METNWKEIEAELEVLRADLTRAEDTLRRLEHADYMASMSDNRYATSGRANELGNRILEMRKRVSELKSRIADLGKFGPPH